MMLFLCSDADVLSLPYTGYAHAILCWCFTLAYSDSNIHGAGASSFPTRRTMKGEDC